MGLGLAGICDLCRILVFLNVLYAPQQLGNRTLPRTRPEPWMANAPMRPAKAASGRFCRSRVCVEFISTIFRTFRKSYIRNPSQMPASPSPISHPTNLMPSKILYFNKQSPTNLENIPLMHYNHSHIMKRR